MKREKGIAALETALCMIPLALLIICLGSVSWLLFQRQAVDDIVDAAFSSFSTRPYVLETSADTNPQSFLRRNDSALKHELKTLLEHTATRLKEQFPEISDRDYVIQVGYEPVLRNESSRFANPREIGVSYQKGTMTLGSNPHLASEMDRYRSNLDRDPVLLGSSYWVGRDEEASQEILLLGMKVHVSFAQSSFGNLLRWVAPEPALSVEKVMPFRGGIG